uniref:Retrotransposon gag domain-containing protein n=1 Tax=Trichuris muris TaxID=70415 RepID=A0A5S6QGF2_TRIMR
MESESAVHRVAAKLPPFWADRAALWFAQIEAQFTVARITEATKFAYVVSQLEGRYAAEVEDITNSPARNAYSHLRSELIRRVSVSAEQRVRQVLIDRRGVRRPEAVPVPATSPVPRRSYAVAHVFDPLAAVGIEDHNAVDVSGILRRVRDLRHRGQSEEMTDQSDASEDKGRSPTVTPVEVSTSARQKNNVLEEKMPPYDSLMETTTEAFARFDMIDDLEESEEKKNYLSFKLIVVNGSAFSPDTA